MKWFIILLSSVSLYGCGFHFRNRSTLPATLNTIYITSPNANLAAALEDTFSSLQVKNVKNSPYQLTITSYQPTQSNPTIVTAGTPATVTYGLTITAELNYKQKTIATKSFSSSQDIIQNINSLQVSKATPSLILQFQNDLVEQVYLWLSSNTIKQQLRPTNAD